jgi:DNA gyrase subunit B
MTDSKVEGITVLSSTAAIRRRAGMYVGDTRNGAGQHRILWSLLDRAVSDHLSGHATAVDLRVEDRRVWFATQGRALPFDPRGGFELFFLEVNSFHDIALTIVNALSRQLQVDVRRDGSVYRQHFACGERKGPAARVCRAADEGIRLAFELDDSVFDLQPWNHQRIEKRALELACLCAGLRIAFNGRTFHARHGLLDLLHARTMNAAITDPIACTGSCDGIDVDAVLTWVDDASSPRSYGFANRERVREGSMYRGLLEGVGAAVANLVPSLATGERLAIAEMFSQGLVAVVHVELDEPRWDQTCTILRGEEPGRAVAYVVERQLTKAWRRRVALGRRGGTLAPDELLTAVQSIGRFD